MPPYEPNPIPPNFCNENCHISLIFAPKIAEVHLAVKLKTATFGVNFKFLNIFSLLSINVKFNFMPILAFKVEEAIL